MEHLSQTASNLIQNALAPSTTRSYNAAFSEYCLFCLHAGFTALPVREETLVLHCTRLANRIAASTIRKHLAAIKYHSTIRGHPFDLEAMNQLYYLIRGIRRQQGNKFMKPPRAPITPTHLSQILHHLHHTALSKSDKRLWWSAVTLAFFGLLRASEYTCPSTRSFDRESNLAATDIYVGHNYMLISIKASKTDPFRVGCTVTIGSTNNKLCPLKATTNYLHSRRQGLGPLYIFTDGTYLTRTRMANFLSTCNLSANLKTHSFRIGGATALAAAGVSDARIQIIGRWRSDCFTRYLRLSPQMLRTYAESMCAVSLDISCWDTVLHNMQ